MNNRQYFEGKVSIVTGASSGIGLATATLLAKYKAKVVLAARSEDKLNEICKNLSQYAEVISVKTDVSVESDCRNLIEQTVKRFGRIDILINNAGISMRAMFKDLDLNVIRRLMDVNFWGTVYCTKYALPYILENKGSIVGVISTAGYKGLPGRTGYSASKFAINGFLDTLRSEHLYDGLHVMIYAPGFTSSNIRKTALMADGSQQGETPREEGKMMTSERVAEIMLNHIRKRSRRATLTFTSKLLLVLTRLFPTITDHMEYWYMAREPDSPFKRRSEILKERKANHQA
ncbi:MAG: SDR family oxidoreductase [Bacteroidaceae bacterium]|nr:SDR family oxidoreductase [Bacteroidaceae bacterium]